MAKWRTTVLLPGALGVDDEDFEHPLYVTPAEIASPFTYAAQGTGWHFPVGYDTHLNRAYFLSGFTDSEWSGEVQIPNDYWRADNYGGTPLSPLITFNYTVSGSAPSKLIADGSITPTPYGFTVGHVGASSGLLLTNANFDGGFGDWAFGGLSDTAYTVIGQHVCGSVTAYEALGPGITTIDMIFTLEAIIYGNSSVMRVWSGSEWLYLSYFSVGIRGILSHEAIPSGYMVEGPDGSRNPDESPTFNAMDAAASVFAPSGSSISVGTANLDSTHFLSPDPELYGDETEALYAVPWEEADHTADDGPYKPIWTNVVILITGEVTSTPPDEL